MLRRIALACLLALVSVGVTTPLGLSQETRPPDHLQSLQPAGTKSEGYDDVIISAFESHNANPFPRVMGLNDADTMTLVPETTGGPDDYGYTWDDTAAYNWIDATTGTDTGLTGDDQDAGPIDIGFGFRFYEKTYNQFYVSTNGLVTFSQGSSAFSNRPIPIPAAPNAFIAPFWDDLAVNYRDYNSGRVYYKRGGSAPNRYLVVEWHAISRLGATDLLTFQVILRETGEIVMQYQLLSGYLYSATVGIEDSVGADGLQYAYNSARGLSNNKAIRFVRPSSPVARVSVRPLWNGAFVNPGSSSSSRITVRNTGDLGGDTYDLISTTRWPLELLREDGVTRFADTNGNGVVDTGPMAAGAEMTVVARVTAPSTSSVGNSNQALLTFRSARDTSQTRTTRLQTAIPATFAQVFRDGADNTMSLYLVRANMQRLRAITGNEFYGYDLSVAESRNGNLVYAWTRSRCVDTPCSIVGSEVEYALFDHSGNLMRSIAKLTDHSAATLSTYDSSLALTVAPNGRIGVVWQRRLYDSSLRRWNHNMYFAVLDSSANLSYGPINLTNNTLWSGDQNSPYFYDPRIAATGDNHFFVAWTRQHEEPGGYVGDIWYTVRSSTGGVVRTNTKLTNDTPGWDDYNESPSLTSLPDNRVLLTMERQWDIYLAVFNSNGNVVRSMERLTNDRLAWGDSDAIRTSNGNIVVAWTGDPPFRPGEQPWTARYYNNETLSGNPVLTRTDDTIDFWWWDDRPHPSVTPDFFSVRWDGTVTLSAGKYVFTMGSDDGSRLWIDGHLVMDHWDKCCTYWSRTLNFTAGTHQIRMEMHEHNGAAWAYLGWWEDTGSVIRYAVLNPAFQLVAGPATLKNEADLLGDDAVSVTADADGNAILTWMDAGSFYPNLYYALVDGGSGNVLTAPMIYHTSSASEPFVFTGYNGNGNTTLVAQPWRVYLPMLSQPRDLCEPNNGRSETRCPLKSGATYRAYISSPKEWDFYYIDLPTERIVEVWLEQIPAGHDYDVYLFDMTGATKGYSANFGNANEYIRTTEQLPGDRYYVAVKGISGSSATQAYSLRSVFR